jgi:hypothetical protein
MTWKDKLEIGLKEDAPFRKDNLPDEQVRGPEIPSGPGRSPQVPAARAAAKGQTRQRDARRRPRSRKP